MWSEKEKTKLSGPALKENTHISLINLLALWCPGSGGRDTHSQWCWGTRGTIETWVLLFSLGCCIILFSNSGSEFIWGQSVIKNQIFQLLWDLNPQLLDFCGCALPWKCVNVGHKSLLGICPLKKCCCFPIGGAVFYLLLRSGPVFRETGCAGAGGLTPGGPPRSI